MSKISIAITGLSGVIGRRFSYHSKYNTSLTNLNHRKPTTKNSIQSVFLDLYQTETIRNILRQANPKVIVHLAAITHIDRCETEKNDTNGSVWKVNVEATRQIVEYCQESNTKLVYISTENVFSGIASEYSENSVLDPVSWYGNTKAVAENLVRTLNDYTIIRAVSAYDFMDSSTFLGSVYHTSELKKPLAVVDNHFQTISFIPDIIKTIDLAIEGKISETIHVCGKMISTPYSAVKAIKKTNQNDRFSFYPVSLENYFQSSADLRTKNAILNTAHSQSIVDFRFTELSDVILG